MFIAKSNIKAYLCVFLFFYFNNIDCVYKMSFHIINFLSTIKKDNVQIFVNFLILYFCFHLCIYLYN